MKKITSTIFLLLALWLGVLGQTPPAFYYQASLRTDDGTAMVNQAADFQVELRQGSSSGELVYAETHSASTDAQGVIALTIGGGTATSGDFGAVPWDQSIFLLVSIKLPDSDDFAPLGENEIHAVPYSVFAAQGNEGPEGEAGETGVGIEWLGMFDSAPDAPEQNQAYYNSAVGESYIFDGTAWQTLAKDGIPAEAGEPGSSIEWLGMFETAPAEPVLNQAYYNATDGNSYIFDGTQWSLLVTKGEVGTTTELPVGTVGNFIAHDGTGWIPTARIRNSDNSVVVSREAASATDAPIFAVYNSAGELVFAVHQGGTRVYVGDDAGKAGSKGGFAVGGLTQNKGEENYLTIMPDSVRFGIVESAKSGSKGGFAVGGLTQNKFTPTHTYLNMAYDSARITVVDNELKGSKGGFAVGGLTQSKEDPIDFFNLNADTTYIATTFAAQSDVIAQAAVTVAGPIVTAPVKDIDGNIYSTIDIGPQRWMAENLRVTRYRDGTPIATGLTQLEWQDTTIGVYTIYDSGLVPEILTDSVMNAMYGKLYNSYAATSSLGLCPAGWVVPDIDDWYSLIEYLGEQPVAGGFLKSIRTAPMDHPRWDAPNASASNLSGFKALPGGDYSSDGFGGIGSVANFWTKTYSELYGSYFNLTFDIAEVIDMEAERFFGLSVRCIKTDALPPKITTNPVTDISYIVAKGGGTLTDDGGAEIDSIGIVWAPFENPTLENNLGKAFAEPTQTSFAITVDMLEENTTYYVRAFAANKAGVSYGSVVSFKTIFYPNCGIIEHLGENYQTIEIGDQCWMRENLRATTFRGGEPLESGFWTDIENIGGYWEEFPEYTDFYGYTYNWAAAKVDSICPAGWYMPEASDWQILIDFLDGEMVAGGKLKGTRIYDMENPDNHPYWNAPNQDATNESGFSAYPAGSAWPGNKGKMGMGFGEEAYFWSKTEGESNSIYLLSLSTFTGEALVNQNSKSDGYSIRCLSSGGKPRVKTQNVEVTGTETMNLFGTITDNGGFPVSSYGFVWSADPDPTIDINEGIEQYTGDFLGDFNHSLAGLQPNTSYYVKVFATNEKGTVYGKELVAKTFLRQVSDLDGNDYFTVMIGDQEWMTSNLRTTKFRDGTLMQKVDWYSPEGAYTWWNGSTAQDSIGFASSHGAYYSASAVISDIICPSGWYVPTKEDYMILLNGLEESEYSGKMLQANVLDPEPQPAWISSGGGITNETGFSALPAGSFDGSSSYSNEGYMAFWWTSTEGEPFKNSNGLVEFIIYNDGYVTINDYTSPGAGHNVRCISTQGKPRVKTSFPKDITTTSAMVGGTVIDDGDFEVSERGVIWSKTNPNPTFDSSYDGNETTLDSEGEFEFELSGLASSTTYYLRAYAQNSQDYGYGSVVYLTTYTGTMSDLDGNTYYTIAIGDQLWMAENLRTTKYADGITDISIVSDPLTWEFDFDGAGAYMYDDPTYADTMGVLYNFYAVTNAAGLCPTNWKVPSDIDWKLLELNIGLDPSVIDDYNERGDVAYKLKEAGTYGWEPENADATNETGFTGRGGGTFTNIGSYTDYGYVGYWWTSTEETDPLVRSIANDFSSISRSYMNRNNGLSVRCIQDDGRPVVFTEPVTDFTHTSGYSGGNVVSEGDFPVTEFGVVWDVVPNPEISSDPFTIDGSGLGGVYTSFLTSLTPNTTYYIRAYATNSSGTSYGNEVTFKTYAGTVTDYNGNTYYTLNANGKEWMASNLKTKHFHNVPNDEIPYVSSAEPWSDQFSSALTWYDNGTLDSATMVDNYGLLYNWFAVADSRNLCPTGWHVPTQEEWNDLITYLGGDQVAGAKLRSTRTEPDDHPRWNLDNIEASDEIGFSAYPAGQRYEIDGSYYDFGNNGMFWTSSELDTDYSWMYYLSTWDVVITLNQYNKRSGFSVRCVRD